MIGPEVETRTIFTTLIADLIASLHSLISPLLAIVDSVRAITCGGSCLALADVGAIAGARSSFWTARRSLFGTRLILQELSGCAAGRTSGNVCADISRTRPGACTWFQVQEALELPLTGPGSGRWSRSGSGP
jgi:hypothetical protein